MRIARMYVLGTVPLGSPKNVCNKYWFVYISPNFCKFWIIMFNTVFISPCSFSFQSYTLQLIPFNFGKLKYILHCIPFNSGILRYTGVYSPLYSVQLRYTPLHWSLFSFVYRLTTVYSVKMEFILSCISFNRYTPL